MRDGDGRPTRCFLWIGAFMADVFDKLLREISSGSRLVSLSGLISVAAKAFVLARLRTETGKVFAVVTESNSGLDAWNSDLSYFQSEISDPKRASFTFFSLLTNSNSLFAISCKSLLFSTFI